MKLLLIFSCQGADLWSLPPEAWPRMGDPAPEAAAMQDESEEQLGIEAFVLFSQFDDGLRIENSTGAGIDLEFGWHRGEKVVFGFSVGFAGWGTDNDQGAIDDRVTITQYRASFWVDFRFKEVVELGLAGTAGYYRYRRDGEHDTSPFIEFEGSIGFVPSEYFKAGLVVLATHTQSSFNRSHTHLFHNYAVGPFVEVRF